MEEVEEIVTWLELVGRVVAVPTKLLDRVRRGDDALIAAIGALFKADVQPATRFERLRDFVITQALSDPESIAAPTRPTSTSRPLPFDVPETFLEAWFGPLDRRIEPDVGIDPREKTAAHLLRVRTFYDSVMLPSERGMRAESSPRLFGNANIGNQRRSNLQTAGQLTTMDVPFLISSWWLSTIPWPKAEHFLARSVVTLLIGDRQEGTIIGYELWNKPQPLLVPIPPRHNFSVSAWFPTDEEMLPIDSRPLFIFVEGWMPRRDA